MYDPKYQRLSRDNNHAFIPNTQTAVSNRKSSKRPATSQSCEYPEGRKYTISAYEPMRRKFYSKQGTQVVTSSAQNRGKCFQEAKIVPARAPTTAVIYRKAALKSNGLEDPRCLIYWGFFSGMGLQPLLSEAGAADEVMIIIVRHAPNLSLWPSLWRVWCHAVSVIQCLRWEFLSLRDISWSRVAYTIMASQTYGLASRPLRPTWGLTMLYSLDRYFNLGSHALECLRSHVDGRTPYARLGKSTNETPLLDCKVCES